MSRFRTPACRSAYLMKNRSFSESSTSNIGLSASISAKSSIHPGLGQPRKFLGRRPLPRRFTIPQSGKAATKKKEVKPRNTRKIGLGVGTTNPLEIERFGHIVVQPHGFKRSRVFTPLCPGCPYLTRAPLLWASSGLERDGGSNHAHRRRHSPCHLIVTWETHSCNPGTGMCSRWKQMEQPKA